MSDFLRNLIVEDKLLPKQLSLKLCYLFLFYLLVMNCLRPILFQFFSKCDLWLKNCLTSYPTLPSAMANPRKMSRTTTTS